MKVISSESLLLIVNASLTQIKNVALIVSEKAFITMIVSLSSF